MINTIENNNNIKKKNKHKHSIQCLNCGYKGHTISTCNYPITSYGIICYYIKNREIKYLMIQRKDTLCYCEFIRGRYKIDDINYQVISGHHRLAILKYLKYKKIKVVLFV